MIVDELCLSWMCKTCLICWWVTQSLILTTIVLIVPWFIAKMTADGGSCWYIGRRSALSAWVVRCGYTCCGIRGTMHDRMRTHLRIWSVFLRKTLGLVFSFRPWIVFSLAFDAGLANDLWFAFVRLAFALAFAFTFGFALFRTLLSVGRAIAHQICPSSLCWEYASSFRRGCWLSSSGALS